MSESRQRRHAGPVLGEPLPLELVNTIHLVRGRSTDSLQSIDDLDAWLREIRPRLATPLSDDALAAIDRLQLTRARDLRGCLREVAEATVYGRQPNPTVLDRLNRYARLAPRWRELRWEEQPSTETCSKGPLVITALSEIAQVAVQLFAGPRREDIKVCGAPGCILFFVKDHPRQEWCSAGCGNRVRAARHYRRTRVVPSG